MKIEHKIIGFAGKMRSGKSECARFLHDNYGFTIVTIANSLKKLCVELLRLDNIEKLNKLKNDNTIINVAFDEYTINTITRQADIAPELIIETLKEHECHTVRELLQVIGTDIIRKYNPQWHIKRTINEIQEAIKRGNCLIAIDDVRFPNELNAIEEVGGKVFYVVRNHISQNEHISETALREDMFNSSLLIENNGTKEQLFQNVISACGLSQTINR